MSLHIGRHKFVLELPILSLLKHEQLQILPLGRRLPDDRLVDGAALLFISNLLVFELFAQGKQC